MKKQRISVQITPGTKAQLAAIAKEEETSISQIAAKAIKNYIKYYQQYIFPNKKF